MKKIFILSIVMIFFFSLTANSAFAGRGHGRGGHGYHHSYGYSHHGYRGHGYHYGGHHRYWGWDAFAVGLGAAIVGSAIINSLEPAPAPTIVEHHTYYNSYDPPQYQGPGPSTYHPDRVWIPGRYIYSGDGHYVYVPGHWAQ